MSQPILVTESLATKYRPKVLDDLIGQDNIATVLKGMIKTRSFPSVFMISGNSGVGKTTVARMICRYVNCDTGKACGKCESCKRVAHPDLVEYNIADTRGIDDIRAIVQSSKISPRFKKRILLLDECHQLTNQAANCFLKSLEEPSKNTIFILATTNPERMLAPVVGRCHRLQLSTISEKSMVRRLYQIAKEEGVDFADYDTGKEVLTLLASLTNGQFRDALQMLETLLFAIASGEDISPKDLLAKYTSTYSVEIGVLAAKTVHALLSHNLKASLRCIIGNPDSRALMTKMRWLINALLSTVNGEPKYETYEQRYFSSLQKKKPIKINFFELLVLQSALVDTEILLNTSPIDPQILLQSVIGKYISGINA